MRNRSRHDVCGGGWRPAGRIVQLLTMGCLIIIVFMDWMRFVDVVEYTKLLYSRCGCMNRMFRSFLLGGLLFTCPCISREHGSPKVLTFEVIAIFMVNWQSISCGPVCMLDVLEPRRQGREARDRWPTWRLICCLLFPCGQPLVG